MLDRASGGGDPSHSQTLLQLADEGGPPSTSSQLLFTAAMLTMAGSGDDGEAGRGQTRVAGR